MKLQLFIVSALFFTACNDSSTHKRKSLGSIESFNANAEAQQAAQGADGNPAPAGPAAETGADAGGIASPDPDGSGENVGDAGEPVPDQDPAQPDSPGNQLDGAALFAENCADCHSNTAKAGRSAAQILNAIQSIGAMRSLQARFPVVNGENDEVSAIANGFLK